MEIDDLEQVMPIENENFSRPWTETGYFTYLIREDALFLVAELEGDIVGYCGVLILSDEGDITSVSVAKSHQGKGVGKTLVKELVERTKQVGVTTLHLEVRQSNQAAISLYQSIGFQEVGNRKNYYEDPIEDALLMTRR